MLRWICKIVVIKKCVGIRYLQVCRWRREEAGRSEASRRRAMRGPAARGARDLVAKRAPQTFDVRASTQWVAFVRTLCISADSVLRAVYLVGHATQLPNGSHLYDIHLINKVTAELTHRRFLVLCVIKLADLCSAVV